MKVDSLRVEFVLVGLATLLSLHLLLLDEPLRVLELVRHSSQLSSGSALLTLGLLLAAAFIVGILVVQATFYFPTWRLIANVRAARMEELRAYALVVLPDAPRDADFRVLIEHAFIIDVSSHELPSTRLPGQSASTSDSAVAPTAAADGRADAGAGQIATSATAGSPPASCADESGRAVAPIGMSGGPWVVTVRAIWALVRRLWRWAWAPLERPTTTPAPDDLHGGVVSPQIAKHVATAMSLALTIGRMEAPIAVTREYEYRRSNRQVFVGCLPALLLTGCAVGRHSVPCRPFWQQVAIVVGVFVCTVLVLGITVRAAQYQEKVAQSMLLDVALITAMRPGRGDNKQVDKEAVGPNVTE